MNVRLTILLVLVLLVFGVTALIVWQTDSGDKAPPRTALYRMNENSIAHIEVTHQGKTVVYDLPRGTADWFIRGDPDVMVFNDKWAGSTLLLSGPKVEREVKANLENPANFGLAPPVTAVKVTDRRGNEIEFHLGDPTPDITQQYARLAGDSALFTVVVSWAEVVNRLATDPPYLRIYQLDPELVVFFEVLSQGQTTSYFIEGPAGEWRIQGPPDVPVFQEKWGDMVAVLSGPRVGERIAKTFEDPAQYGLDPPQTVVTVLEASGQPTIFFLGDTTEDGQFRYANQAGKPVLYAMPIDQAQRIIDLATNPPYPP